jgi:midasin
LQNIHVDFLYLKLPEAHAPRAWAAERACCCALASAPDLLVCVFLQAPVNAMQRRLQELLAEWPEHPLLDQLQAICNRILSLPACGPLKAALTGVELLLSRAQTWEEGAASHVSLASQLQACAHVARRWRAAELSAWPRALEACARTAAAAADATWFPLYRLMFADTPPDEPETAVAWLRGIAAALEEFLRCASLGEYERRVALLWEFHTHALLDVACGTRGAAPLAALLYNLHRYYFQFVAAVRGALDAARTPIQVKLKEHAKLAKWEVRARCMHPACPTAPPSTRPRFGSRLAMCNPSPYGRGFYATGTSQGIAHIRAAVWVGATTLCVCAQFCRKISSPSHVQPSSEPHSGRD